MSEIRIENVVKRWPGVCAVDQVSFTVEQGTLTALLGPSGCGKSTLLRMIAGLEDVTSGSIFIDEQDVTTVEAAKRGVSMVFQSYALFPHLSVRENILFGLKVRKVKKEERRRRLAEAADLVGLTGLLDRKPVQLSGGQRQRVALARTIVSRQPVCLMDEPLSNLDAKLRAEMRTEIRELQQKLGLTVLYVTHDQVEAMTMADQVVLLNRGRVEQIGTPKILYQKPQTVFAAKFIGNPPMNIFPSSLFDHKKHLLEKDCPTIGIRPEDICFSDNGLRMKVVKADFLGSETLLYLMYQGQQVLVKFAGNVDVAVAEEVQVGWDESSVHFFNDDMARSLQSGA